MLVELHLIQNFAPSCLNRDDTNTPKDCEFGGIRRARISSQCIKRAIRWSATFQEQMREHLAIRSLRFPKQVIKLLMEMGVAESSAAIIGKNLCKIAQKEASGKEKQPETKKDSYELDIFKTPQIVFYTTDEVRACAETIKDLLDKGTEPDKVVTQLKKDKSKFPTPHSADIALFGRMVTSDKFEHIDAACQVAHAISTNRVLMDMDFYTAVDDLQPEAETGAGMMGVSGFNSSCFYRYSLIDLFQLKNNLDGDEELAHKTMEAFLRASVLAMPTGKQHSMAAQNLPDAIFAVVRESGVPISLANAFIAPVHTSSERNLVQASIEAMDCHWGKLTAVYGKEGIRACPICLVDQAKLEYLGESKVSSLDDLVKEVMCSISAEETR